MLNKIIQWSIKNRLRRDRGGILLLVYGGIVALRAPVDVFPGSDGADSHDSHRISRHGAGRSGSAGQSPD